jgi:hypothetical protein
MFVDFHHQPVTCGNVDVFGRALLDPVTGVVSAPYPPVAIVDSGDDIRRMGRDGNLYIMSRRGGKIVKYIPASNSYVTVVGNGLQGSCSDTTAAVSCPIEPFDLFVNARGQIYFNDRGRIRVVDASGNVQTIIGQGLAYGDGGPALSARFRTINNIDQRASGAITILDREEYRFREFAIGGAISTIAGNGTNAAPDTVALANVQPLMIGSAGVFWDDYAEASATGDLYFNRGFYLARLNRVTGKWVDLAGGGATSYEVGDGKPGNQIYYPFYLPSVLAFDGTNVMTAIHSYDVAAKVLSNMTFKLYSGAGVQNALSGIVATTAAPSMCPDGTAVTDCVLPPTYGSLWSRAQYDSYGAQWVLLQNGTGAIRKFAGGTVGTLSNLAVAASSFRYRHDASNNVLYYCGSSDGRLHKIDLQAAGPDTLLPWPVASMSCAGRTLLYNTGRNSLIFPYIQNGLMGIAEYSSP